MAVLINTKIIINKPVKYKTWGYYIVVDKEDKERLAIHSIDTRGKSKGIAGYITRVGYINMNRKHMTQLTPLITKALRAKIDMTLDLVFGKDRIAMAKVVRGNLMTLSKKNLQ